MASTKGKLPNFSPRWLCKKPSREVVKRLTLAGLLAVAMAAAFYLGRHGGLGVASGQAPGLNRFDSLQVKQASERGRHVVAYIYGNIPITREELGEYLVERVGPERLDFLVNRKIIEKVCAENNIHITDAEIDAEFAAELKMLNCSERVFVNEVLRPRQKNLFEYKQDSIRLQLSLKRFVEGSVTVDEKDIERGFEAKFGPKVQCLLIAISPERAKDKYDIWQRASRGESEFVEEAKKLNPGPSGAEGGKIPPIHKHFGDSNVEAEAFKLKKGDISPCITLPDGSVAILHCVNHIPADATRSFDKERLSLHKELYDIKVAHLVKRVATDLRKAANPQLFLRRESLTAEAPGARPPLPPTQMPGAPGYLGHTMPPPPPEVVVQKDPPK